MSKLIILGAGGYARTITDIAKQSGKHEEIFYLDDYKQTSDILGKCCDFKKFISPNIEFYPAIGDNTARLEWIDKLILAKADIATFIHSTAYVSPTAVVGVGVAVLPNAVVNTGCVIQDGVIVNCGSVVDHDAIVNRGAHICPCAVVKPLTEVPVMLRIEPNVTFDGKK